MDYYHRTLKVKENSIVLNRVYYDSCTLGVMKFPDGTTLHTMELPWRDNQQRISCIPEGIYDMGLRISGVVARTSRGRYRRGWEVQNVDNRTYIMVHVGNYPSNFEGCIGVGLSSTIYGDGKYMVTHSQKAFTKFMDVMKTQPKWELIVREEGNDI